MQTPQPADLSISPQIGVHWRRWEKVIRLCAWGYLAIVLGVWLLLQMTDIWLPATLLSFAPRWVFAIPLGFLFPAALLRRSRSIPVLLLGTVVAGAVAGFNVPWEQCMADVPKGARFRLMTCNLHGNFADPAQFEALIADSDVDVVAVQEWAGAGRSALRTIPGWYVHNSERLFLASRYPIRAAIALGDHSTSKFASATRYDLDTPFGPVHLISLHLATERHGIRDLIEKKTNGLTEVRDNTARRWDQSQYLAGQALACQGSVLVVGDFNTPPESRIFSQVWRGFNDAFATAGWGFGYTFLETYTTVRIDHILTGPGWTCTHCWVGPQVGSPHRPVFADLYWIGTPANSRPRSTVWEDRNRPTETQVAPAAPRNMARFPSLIGSCRRMPPAATLGTFLCARSILRCRM